MALLHHVALQFDPGPLVRPGFGAQQFGKTEVALEPGYRAWRAEPRARAHNLGRNLEGRDHMGQGESRIREYFAGEIQNHAWSSLGCACVRTWLWCGIGSLTLEPVNLSLPSLNFHRTFLVSLCFVLCISKHDRGL